MQAFLRFCVVGGVCTVLNLLVFWLLVGHVGVSYLVTTVVAFAAVNWVGLRLNRSFTFGRSGPVSQREAARYYAGMAGSLALNLGLMFVLVDVVGSHYLLASLLVTVALLLLNFLLHREWTFRSVVSSGPGGVVLVTHYFPAHGGGVEIVAGQLARRIAANCPGGIEWWSSSVDPAPCLESVACVAVPCVNLLERAGLPIPLWGPVSLWRLARRVATADLVHVHDLLYPGNLLAALVALATRRPLLVTQHLGLVPYRSGSLRAAMAAANRWVAAPVLERADSVVFISDAAHDYFSHFCHWRVPPLLIRNGVDSELYRPPHEGERAAARAALGLEPQRPAYLFVGRFVEKKGMPLLKQLADATPDCHWMFAGRGPLDPARWGLANVTAYVGRSDESLRELYWGADLLVLPSVGEGFPLVIQEAMSCGLAVLTTPETAAGCVEARRELGALDTGTPTEQWVRRLHEDAALEDPSRRARIAGVAGRLWSWQSTAEEYAELVARLCARPWRH